MDTFFEQLVPVKKTTAIWLLIIVIWIVAIGLSVLLYLYNLLGMFGVLIIAGLIYGAYKLTSLFSVEYEYIITNGCFDIDKITAKSSRKRVASFELSDVDRLERYNPSQKGDKNTIFACNPNNSDVYILNAKKQSGGNVIVVFSPNEKIQTAAKKFLPKYISNSAFK